MKKLILFLFFLFPNFVYANSLMLEDLQVINGSISPEFNSLNNYYTITLNKDVDKVLFKYKETEAVITIINNYDLKNNSNVTIEVSKEEEKVIYNFHILKEEESIINVFKEDKENNENPMYAYKIFIIPGVCFILIVMVFKIIFRRHKK